MKMSALDRVLLFLMVLLASYQIVVGIDRLEAGPIIDYNIAFGVLLVAGLLLIILGFEALDAPIVVVVSTIIPLALSLGLVWEHLAAWRTSYLASWCWPPGSDCQPLSCGPACHGRLSWLWYTGLLA
jgi:hypothetical protein